ncbi:MAG: type VI secretion system tip protein VgrG [Ferruginibacter sp.]
MPNERTIPSDGSKSVATFTILSAGNEVSKQNHVLSITINKEVNRIASATLIMLDGEASEQSFKISNQPDFEPGKEIEIKAGFSNQEQTLFKGIVIKHGIKVRKNNSVLVIECRDKAVKMTGASKSGYYKEVKDSEVMEDLIGKYGLDKDVKPTTYTHKQLVQYSSTDWDFMLCRADANGMLCFSDDNKLSISKPEFSGNAVLTVQFGATVLDLDAEIDARFQYKTITGSTWNYTTQELSDSIEAESASVPQAGNLDNSTLAGVINEEKFVLANSAKMEDPEIQSWVNAMMMKHQLAKIRGRVRIDGTPAVKPGQLIQLNGAGDRFEGKLFITGVRHEVENGTWQSVLQFGINPEWFAETYNIQSSMAGALLPGVDGLQIGVVTQLQEDPDGEDRILVRIPVIHKADDGAWCRVCTLDAGKERGSFFRPEIGDEVVVGFINNDPRHGMVLGMCNSSDKPAPITAADENHEKGFQTRSKMKMIFNDDKKSFTLETPGGNKFIISEDEKKIHFEDQNGNKLTMNEDGIKIESIKDITFKAAKDIKVEGVNVGIKGSAQTKVEGASGAEISSGGSTTVKGSMVQIN